MTPIRRTMTSWPQPQKQTGSAARPCPGKLPEGPARSKASGWGLPCERLSLHKARTEGQVADCGTTGIRHNRAVPAPAPCRTFMNGPTSQTADWLSLRPQGPIISCGRLVSAWGLSSFAAVTAGEPPPHLPPRRGGGGLYLFSF